MKLFYIFSIFLGLLSTAFCEEYVIDMNPGTSIRVDWVANSKLGVAEIKSRMSFHQNPDGTVHAEFEGLPHSIFYANDRTDSEFTPEGPYELRRTKKRLFLADKIIPQFGWTVPYERLTRGYRPTIDPRWDYYYRLNGNQQQLVLIPQRGGAGVVTRCRVCD